MSILSDEPHFLQHCFYCESSDSSKLAIAEILGSIREIREIRVDNVLKDAKGEEIKFKPGSEVDVTIEVDPKAIQPNKKS